MVQQSHLEQSLIASIYNNDYIGIASYNILVGTTIAIVLGVSLVLDSICLERRESSAVKTAWKVCVTLVSIMVLADALAFTVIVATKQADIEGLIW